MPRCIQTTSTTGAGKSENQPHRDDLRILHELAVKVVGTCADIEGAQAILAVHDAMDDLDVARFRKPAEVVGGRRRGRQRIESGRIGRQGLAGIVIQDGELHGGLGVQRGQQLPGGKNILEAQDPGMLKASILVCA